MKKILAEIQELELKLAETGPRGGKIIGKTRSGKPIYDSHGHSAHKGFSHADHADAAVAHLDKMNQASKHKYKASPDRAKLYQKAYDHHHKQWQKHTNSVSGRGPIQRTFDRLTSPL